MPVPREQSTLALGLLAFCTGTIVLLLALVLGFNLAGTTDGAVRSAKGQRVAVPGVVAVVTAVVALNGRRRRWGFGVACVGVAAAAVAVLLMILLPGEL
ncbi:hypothetical protein [Microlunatus flavus]|uniref:Uncharacterized protein n=1 Tax=Microlunatus flavus TaxID=1036181 RepID=A0A1H9B4F5_9ACTN|nr:hypothetical protein [Microlunatus flavus]SEP83920.1 hypothetical protein SAMN05421756_101841 [Microlunatus flavus]